MSKALSEWTKHDLDEFFERHELTPQQIVPVLGSGALTMTQMAAYMVILKWEHIISRYQLSYYLM